MKRGPFEHPFPLMEGQMLFGGAGVFYIVKGPVNNTFNGHIVTLEPVVPHNFRVSKYKMEKEESHELEKG